MQQEHMVSVQGEMHAFNKVVNAIARILGFLMHDN
jgi:hypothetical protein